jgi:hypothetical protein
MGGKRIFTKLRASLFNDNLSNEPNSAGSISLDRTFKKVDAKLKRWSKFGILRYPLI